MATSTLSVQLALFDAVPEPPTESDGLTVDTPHGPVDLVAVDRALAGEQLHLTRAEHKYIAALFSACMAIRPCDQEAA
jgi:hypothetical protein